MDLKMLKNVLIKLDLSNIVRKFNDIYKNLNLKKNDKLDERNLLSEISHKKEQYLLLIKKEK